MNLNSPELLGSLEDITSKLADGISIEDITSMIQLPQLDQFSEIASTLLPQNLTQTDESGNVKLLSPLELQDTVKQGVENLKGIIEQEIVGVIDQVTSVANQAKEVVDSGINSINELGTLLTSNQTAFFEQAIGSVAGIAGISIDTGILSQFGNTVSNVTNSIKELSPKQIRDLSDPEYYKKVVSTTLDTATQALESDVLQTAAEYVTPPASIGAVASLFTTANSLLNTSGPKGSSDKETVEVVVSTYHSKGDGADIDAINNKTATGKKLVSGKSCAVDNVKILFNSKVEVPGLGAFEAVDRVRGGGVGLLLYYETLEEAIKAQTKIKGPMLVTVTPPGGLSTAIPNLVSKRGSSAKLI